MSLLEQRVISGDTQAVLEFYKTYSPKILGYLIKRLPRKEDAQEIMQDVFLDALDNLPFFQQKSTLLSWLYGIAGHKVVDFYRKKKIKSIILSTVPLLQLAAQEIHEPEFQFEKNKIRDRIEKAFAALSLNNQKILFLKYEQGNSVKEIAFTLNLSTKATESLLFRARQNFKIAYERA